MLECISQRLENRWGYCRYRVYTQSAPFPDNCCRVGRWKAQCECYGNALSQSSQSTGSFFTGVEVLPCRASHTCLPNARAWTRSAGWRLDFLPPWPFSYRPRRSGCATPAVCTCGMKGFRVGWNKNVVLSHIEHP